MPCRPSGLDGTVLWNTWYCDECAMVLWRGYSRIVICAIALSGYCSLEHMVLSPALHLLHCLALIVIKLQGTGPGYPIRKRDSVLIYIKHRLGDNKLCRAKFVFRSRAVSLPDQSVPLEGTKASFADLGQASAWKA